MAEDAEELTTILQHMEVPCKVLCTPQLDKHMAATQALEAKAELFAECPMVWWPFEEFLGYCDATNASDTSSSVRAVGFCEYCGRIGTNVHLQSDAQSSSSKRKEQGDVKAEAEQALSWRACAGCPNINANNGEGAVAALFCSDKCEGKGSDLHAFLNCAAVAKLRRYQATEVKQQTKEIIEARKKKEEAEKAKRGNDKPDDDGEEEEETWNFFPISLEALARCVATLAVQYYRLRLSYPNEPVDVLFAHASQRFNRLVAPPGDVEFGEILEAKWYDLVATTMRPGLLAVFRGGDETSATATTTKTTTRNEGDDAQRVVDALLSKETLRTLLGQLSLNAQALNITWPSQGGKEEKEGEALQRPCSVAGGVFMLQSCFNHSCYPNVELLFSETNEITIRTKRAVAKGDQLCITYIPEVYLALENTEQRRKRLSSYFFVCQCECCAHPKGQVKEVENTGEK